MLESVLFLRSASLVLLFFNYAHLCTIQKRYVFSIQHHGILYHDDCVAAKQNNSRAHVRVLNVVDTG